MTDGHSTGGTDREVCKVEECDNKRHSGWTLCISHGRKLIEVWNQ